MSLALSETQLFALLASYHGANWVNRHRGAIRQMIQHGGVAAVANRFAPAQAQLAGPQDTSVTRGNQRRPNIRSVNRAHEEITTGPRFRRQNPELFNNENNNVSPNINNNNSMSKRSATPSQQVEDEIPVMPVPKSLSKIVPDYFTISLPIRGVFTTTYSSTSFNSTRVVLNDLNSTFSSAGSLDYLGLSQWKALFQYYRIISGHLEVEVWNHTTLQSDLTGADRIEQLHTRASVEHTDSTSARLTTARKMVEGKHNITAVVANTARGENYRTKFVYDYDPSSFIKENGHVSEVGDESRWTAVAASPAHPHYAHIVVTDNAGTNAASTIKVAMEIKYSITVQFREIVDSILTTSQTSA